MGAVESRGLAPRVRLGEAATKRLGGLAWKLNRLRCMTPAEISHRVIQAASMQVERLGLARVVVPEADLEVCARPWIHRDARVDPQPYLAAADRVVAGRHDVFALRDHLLGNPPRWNRDPKTGTEAPLAFGKQLDYRDPAIVGDCKYLWEPNRHLHLVTLAQAWALSGEQRYADTLRVHLESWWRECPPGLGVNWSSSLEAGLRLVNWALAWQLLGGARSPLFEGADGAGFRDRWLASVYHHAEFVCGHFSLHSSANNHLVGEAAGAFCASLAWPHWKRAARWHDVSRRILEREALLQNAPDGANREQATSYQQFTFDLLLVPLLAARANGQDFPAAVTDRLESMLGFIASLMDVGGHVPMFGDADDAHVARLDPRQDFCRYQSMLATGAILFQRGDLKAKAPGVDDKTRWLLGPLADARFDAIMPAGPLPVRRAFPDGGYYILGCDFEAADEIRLVADAGPLGYREIAAHGHADALSFTLSVGGREFLVDPGTFAYHTEPRWRAWFRGTSAHNTVRVDGVDQSGQGGSFMWLRKARAACTAFMCTADADVFEGWHDGYTALPDPVVHRRRMVLDKRARAISIEDTLEMAGRHEVELNFHVAEDCEVSRIAGGVALAQGGRTVRLRWPEVPGCEVQLLRGSEAPIAGWVSRRFDEKVASTTIRWRASLRGETLLRTFIDC